MAKKSSAVPETFDPFAAGGNEVPFDAEDKDDLVIDLSDVAESKPVEPGVYILKVSSVKRTGTNRKFVELRFEIADGSSKGMLVRDRLDLTLDFHRERLVRFAEAAGIENKGGRRDFSEGALVGKTVGAYVKWNDFIDANAPSRYHSPKAAPDGSATLR